MLRVVWSCILLLQGRGGGSCSSEGAGQAEERAASEIEVWVTLDHGRQTLEKHDKIH